MKYIFSSAIRVCLFIAIFSSIQLSSSAQDLGGLIKKVKKATGKITRSLEWEPGQAVSTSLKDTLPGIYWLNDYLKALTPDTITTFELTPGYYKTTIRSYCLHAGMYGPSKGSGYQIADFKGTQRALITAILERSVSHPDIPQMDIQTLIWGIEAGQRFSAYPADFQLRIKPLLTVKEIALMEVSTDKLSQKVLPDEVQNLLSTYASMRQQMQSTQVDYDHLEEIAVKAGVPPLGAGSVNIEPGKWSYLNSGYYITTIPQGYSTTDLYLYRPETVSVTYDAQGRISGYASEGNQIQLNYKNNGIAFQVGEHTAHQQTLESYTVRNSTGQEQTLPTDTKYIDWGIDITHDIIQGARDWGLDNIVKKNTGIDLETLQKSLENIEKWKGRYDDLKELKGDLDNIPPQNLDKYLNEAAINETINNGLKVSLNPLDKKRQAEWIKNNLRMVMDFFLYSYCQLRGDNCQQDNDPHKPGLPNYIAQPGNTGMQRLGMSEFKK